MNDISQWLNDKVYPAIFEKADEIFTEHNFKRYGNNWRSQTYLNGSPHEKRPDKTVITSRAPYCILEQGGEVKSLYDYIKGRNRLTDKHPLDKLSQLSGVSLPQDGYTQSGSYQANRTRDQILEDANGYFIYCLEISSGAKEVRDYLQAKRGYSEADIKAMDLGYIPSQDKLIKYLTETKNHKPEDVNKALNLIKGIGESHVLTIPFRESSGQIRGFIVRTIKQGVEPKYYYSTGLNQKEEINKALELLSKQSKQLIQKDKEAEYSRLLLPIKEDELKQVCLDLKDLAVETSLPIILGAQFNREVTHHLLLHPTKIGEAGDIERLANLIVGLWNNNFEILAGSGEENEINRRNIKEPNTIYVKILKNRGGRIGVEGLLSFNGNMGKISNDPISIF